MKLKISYKRTKKCRGSSSIMLEGSYELPAFSIWISAFFVCAHARIYNKSVPGGFGVPGNW